MNGTDPFIDQWRPIGIRKELEQMSEAEREAFLRVYGHLEGMLDRCVRGTGKRSKLNSRD